MSRFKFVIQLIVILLCSNLVDLTNKSECFDDFKKFTYQRNGTVDLFAFKNGIQRFIFSNKPDANSNHASNDLHKVMTDDEQKDQDIFGILPEPDLSHITYNILIVYASSYIYLFKDERDKNLNSPNFLLKHCFSPQKGSGENRILFELIENDSPKRYLICNVWSEGSSRCSILQLTNENELRTEIEFPFNLDFDLKLCSVDFSSKLIENSHVNFLLSCTPDNVRSSPYLTHLDLDLNKNSFRILDGNKSILVRNPAINSRTNIILTFDTPMNSSALQDFSFILKTEQIDGQSPVTKLGRICSLNFNSYGEFPLNCKAKGTDEIYSLATSAHFDSTSRKKFLYVTFNKFDTVRSKIDESSGSILCAFEYEELLNFFKYAAEQCYQGKNKKVSLMSQYFVGRNASLENRNSTKKCSKATSADMCTSSILSEFSSKFFDSNPLIEYRDPFEGHFLFRFKNNIITSIASSSFQIKTKRYNLLFLGTKRGIVYEFVGNTYEFKYKFELNDLPLNIRPNPFIERASSYFIVSNFLVRYSIDLSRLNISLPGSLPEHEASETTSKERWILWSFIGVGAVIAIFFFYKSLKNRRISKLNDSATYYQTTNPDPNSLSQQYANTPSYATYTTYR